MGASSSAPAPPAQPVAVEPEVDIAAADQAYDAAWRRERLNWIALVSLNSIVVACVAGVRTKRWRYMAVPIPGLIIGTLYAADDALGLKRVRVQHVADAMYATVQDRAAPRPPAPLLVPR